MSAYFRSLMRHTGWVSPGRERPVSTRRTDPVPVEPSLMVESERQVPAQAPEGEPHGPAAQVAPTRSAAPQAGHQPLPATPAQVPEPRMPNQQRNLTPAPTPRAKEIGHAETVKPSEPARTRPLEKVKTQLPEQTTPAAPVAKPRTQPGPPVQLDQGQPTPAHLPQAPSKASPPKPPEVVVEQAYQQTAPSPVQPPSASERPRARPRDVSEKPEVQPKTSPISRERSVRPSSSSRQTSLPLGSDKPLPVKTKLPSTTAPARPQAPMEARGTAPKETSPLELPQGPALVKMVRDWVSQTPLPGERGADSSSPKPEPAAPQPSQVPLEKEQTISIGAINLTVEAPPQTAIQTSPPPAKPAKSRPGPAASRLDRHYFRL